MITQVRLKQVVQYDPKTGVFRWIKDRAPMKSGEIAGCINSAGYTVIRIDRKLYTANRLAFLYMTGAFPEKGSVIDHINSKKIDDRWENLRKIPYGANTQRGKQRKNASGFRGVLWCKQSNKWQARLKKDSRSKHLGYFDCKIAAAKAYNKEAVIVYGKHAALNKIGAKNA